ncbi:MAG: NAD-dependent isocitrate dehydrogenase [Methanobacteriaceae archaeon]|jgi:methanogen homoisocitrate dehydrogenase|nr:NAD-dependent isocitrate dehydrogenase [Candidatus Methanorudis spinitermitis]
MIKITVIPGDGIGKEVMDVGIEILECLSLNIDFIEAEAGYECFKKNGTTLPEETIKNAKKSSSTLFGASTSTPNEKSPIIELRKKLDVFANLRPVKSFQGIKSFFNGIDFLIIRENTEGLYSQIESIEDDGNKTIANRIITRKASMKISDFAFKKAIGDNRKKVSCVHKANVLKKTDGVFRESFYKIASSYSNKYPQIIANDFYIDAMAMYLVMKPQKFDVIVTTNLFGDILSDEGAGLVGGLGLSPSANIGDKNGLFEPVHGSAPDIAGRQIANPIAMILSISMMLDFLKEKYYSEQVELAVENVLKAKKVLTPDLGGKSKTMDLANAIKDELKNLI